MIKHIVILRFVENTSSDVIDTFKQALESLVSEIEPLVSMEVGLNANERETFHLSLTATLTNWEGLDLYAQHPAHLACLKVIKPFVETRACVDYKIG